MKLLSTSSNTTNLTHTNRKTVDISYFTAGTCTLFNTPTPATGKVPLNGVPTRVHIVLPYITACTACTTSFPITHTHTSYGMTYILRSSIRPFYPVYMICETSYMSCACVSWCRMPTPPATFYHGRLYSPHRPLCPPNQSIDPYRATLLLHC